MQTGNLTNISWNTQSYMTVFIDNDNNIVGLNGQVIGVTSQKHQEVEQGLKKCKDKLIELGVIKVPKTQEEILKEQQELVEKQNKVINELLERLNNEQKPTPKFTEPSTSKYEGQNATSVEQGTFNGKPRGNKQPSTSETSHASTKCTK